MKLKPQSLRDLTAQVERSIDPFRYRATADRPLDEQQELAAAEIIFVDRYSRLVAATRTTDESLIAGKAEGVGAK